MKKFLIIVSFLGVATVGGAIATHEISQVQSASVQMMEPDGPYPDDGEFGELWQGGGAH